MLLLKLMLAPGLVALATLAARRWGPSVGGIVVGFPLSAGPIFLFLALEQGLAYAQQAVVGILLGMVGAVAFALAYAAAAKRTSWLISLASATATFAVASATVGAIDWTLSGSSIIAFLVLCVAITFLPRPIRSTTVATPAWWDLWVRMGAAAIMTLVITSAAGAIGPLHSGILATFPVVASVIVTFTHHQQGAAAATAMLRGSILSWFSFAGFFLAIGLALPIFGLAGAMGLGAASVVVSSPFALWIDRMAARRTQKSSSGERT